MSSDSSKRWVFGPPEFLPQAGLGKTASHGGVWSGDLGPGVRHVEGCGVLRPGLGTADPEFESWMWLGGSATSATTITTKIKTFAWLGK